MLLHSRQFYDINTVFRISQTNLTKFFENTKIWKKRTHLYFKIGLENQGLTICAEKFDQIFRNIKIWKKRTNLHFIYRHQNQGLTKTKEDSLLERMTSTCLRGGCGVASNRPSSVSSNTSSYCVSTRSAQIFIFYYSRPSYSFLTGVNLASPSSPIVDEVEFLDVCGTKVLRVFLLAVISTNGSPPPLPSKSGLKL